MKSHRARKRDASLNRLRRLLLRQLSRFPHAEQMRRIQRAIRRFEREEAKRD